MMVQVNTPVGLPAPFAHVFAAVVYPSEGRLFPWWRQPPVFGLDRIGSSEHLLA